MTRRRWLLLIAAVIAGAGVAYELSLMLLGTVTVGSTERANAIVLGTAMLGMGVGATNGGRLADRPVRAFVATETVLALLGAAAAPMLYWTWARMDSFWGPLLGVSFAIGVCIGAEMPLLAALNQRLADHSPAKVVADYTAADYFGALFGAVGFAFAVRPWLGIVTGTVVIAGINLLAAAAVLVIVPGDRPRRAGLWVVGGFVGLVLLALAAPPIVDDGRQAKFRDPVLAVTDTGIQELVVTSRIHPGGVVDTRLFLDGDLQLSSVDEYRYHESLVHPAIGRARDVLILGGGDCLAVREVLRHSSVESVTLVELDGAVTELMQELPELELMTEGACADPRLELVTADAFTWIDDEDAVGDGFDTVIVDFPDPDTPALGRLYSLEFYQQVSRVIRPGGAMVVQCGSPFFAPEAYWTCAETIEAAGWSLVSYHVDVPSFGDWGFHLATLGPVTELDPDAVTDAVGLRFLDADVLRAAQVFPRDIARDRYEVEVSTVLDPVIVDAAQGAWIGYDG